MCNCKADNRNKKHKHWKSMEVEFHLRSKSFRAYHISQPFGQDVFSHVCFAARLLIRFLFMKILRDGSSTMHPENRLIKLTAEVQKSSKYEVEKTRKKTYHAQAHTFCQAPRERQRDGELSKAAKKVRNKGIFMKRSYSRSKGKKKKCHERPNHTKKPYMHLFEMGNVRLLIVYTMKKSKQPSRKRKRKRQVQNNERIKKTIEQVKSQKVGAQRHSMKERPKLSKMWSFKANAFALTRLYLN